MDKTPAGKAPGLLYAASRVTKTDLLSREEYIDWYGKEHVPDVFKTGSVDEAYIWEALDHSAKRPVLVTYPLKDTAFLSSKELANVPTQYDSLPGSGQIAELTSFDVRSYKSTQLFEPQNGKPGQSDYLVAAAFTPADDEDYDNWYRQEHLFDVAKVPGWRRTERYELLPPGEIPVDSEVAEPPKFLTLHFIDGDEFPAAELTKLTESEWTKKNMSTMKKSEIEVYEKASYHAK